MSSIRLDFLKSNNIPRKQKDSKYQDDHTVSIADNFTYKDLYLDLDKVQAFASKGLNAKSTFHEIKTANDLDAIMISIKNILQTVPGQKLLNPYFGLNLMHLVFQPITQYTGQQISQAIAKGLTAQEPRITIQNVHTTGLIDQNTYKIDIRVLIPSLNNTHVYFGGTVSVNGVRISKIENESIT
jgi:phage baseplate assembly protein W